MKQFLSGFIVAAFASILVFVSILYYNRDVVYLKNTGPVWAGEFYGCIGNFLTSEDFAKEIAEVEGGDFRVLNESAFAQSIRDLNAELGFPLVHIAVAVDRESWEYTSPSNPNRPLVVMWLNGGYVAVYSSKSYHIMYWIPDRTEFEHMSKVLLGDYVVFDLE